MDSQGCLEPAIAYVKRGLPIVLLDGKRPRQRNWGKLIYSECDLRATFAAKPYLGLGLILGERSGLLDIESDSPEQETAFQELFAGVPLPKTPAWQSRRGTHRLFKLPPQLLETKRGVIHLPAGLAVRIGADGKQIQSAIPPTTTDGFQRTWLASLDDYEPAELPNVVVDRILAALNRVAPSSAADKMPAAMAALRKVEKAVHADGSNRLLCLARQAVRYDLDDSEAIAAIRQVESEQHAPCTWSDADIVTRLRSTDAARGEALPKAKAKSDPAGEIVRAAQQHDRFFHTADGSGYVETPVNGHPEILRVKEERYKHVLRVRYSEAKQGATAKGDWLKNAVDQLEAVAALRNPLATLYLRIAESGGCIYVDLANEGREVAKVEPTGWQIVELADCPVQFYRPTTMLPLPRPEQGGTLDDLWPLVNIPADDRPLFAAALVMMFHPSGPYPLLALSGRQGSGKSRLAWLIQQLIDATQFVGAAEPAGDEDLLILANNRWLLSFDNLSAIKPSLSDAFCRLSTGAAFGRRKKYTDSDQTVFASKRPVMLTSIGDVLTAADLLDRSIRFDLPTLRTRCSEAELNARFGTVQPKLLGVLLNGVSSALRNLPNTTIDDPPRMLDFALWGTAAEEGLGLPAGSVMASYRDNRQSTNALLLDNELAGSLLALQLPFTGTAKDLAKALGYKFSDIELGRFGTLLRQLEPSLESAGIIVTRTRVAASRQLTIERRPKVALAG